jgi:fibronectin type 3 domain-containing protein
MVILHEPAVAGGMNNSMQPKKVDLSNHQNIKHGKRVHLRFHVSPRLPVRSYIIMRHVGDDLGVQSF